MTPPVRALLADGRRWHFQHGPIDLVIEAFGAPDQVIAAYEAAWQRFQSILVELVDELLTLRAPVGQPVSGAVARRMKAACEVHRGVFVTPMAAVAGAVADEVLAAMTATASLDRAYVNNGGDIAIHLMPGESFRTGIVTLGAAPALDGFADITAGVGGIATSGWRGRSLSLGIADSVTVLAASAAEADVAATLIANAVSVADPAVHRRSARTIDADSDLGDQLVTVDVGPLSTEAATVALERGLAVAREMKLAALVTLQGTTVTTVDGLEIAA
jgi:uncharacterized protein